VTDRFTAVLGRPETVEPPPGVDPDELRLALLEDTYEVVAGLDFVTPVLALTGPDPGAEKITWPGTRVLHVDGLEALLRALHELGAEQAAVVAHDAPDLPALLVGKLFRALGGGRVAVCPAEGGGLVALAARLPAPGWLAGIDLDTPDATVRLRAAAATPGAVRSAPGWHRLRSPADLARLDPGLEGWENTRALLLDAT
jgi:glycosyltransferase A (GT-A) superfamily protein (DUF2064 family)